MICSNCKFLFFTNNSTLTNKVEVIPGISDHEAVFIESSLRPLKVKVPPRKVFMYKDIDYNPMKDELRKFYGQYQESSKKVRMSNSYGQNLKTRSTH